MVFREIAMEVAQYIENDEKVHEHGRVNVVVEDKDDVSTLIQIGLGEMGLVVLVAVTGFDRRTNSGPVLSGTMKIEIRIMEHPSMGRDDSGTITAQGMAEHLATILHWRRFSHFAGPLRFEGFFRDDVEEANIVRENYAAEVSLGITHNN